MTTTGWTGEPPEGPSLPLTSMLLAQRERGPGDTLEMALARSRAEVAREEREAAAEAPDPDERAAAFVTRGYMPGMVSQLSQRLGDTLAELQGEQAKIEKGQRRQEQVRRAHAAGRITAFDIARMDFGEGDPDVVARLERRAEGLRRQLAEASELISPEQRAPDPLEAVNRTANEFFRATTRQRVAELGTRQANRPAPRPFGSVSRSAASTEHTGADCWVCAEGRRSEADPAPYAPGAVITTGYREIAR